MCRGMEQMQAVLVEAQRAQQACPGRQLNVLGAPSLLLRLQLRRLWQVTWSACMQRYPECRAIASKGAAAQNTGAYNVRVGTAVQAQWQPP